MPDRFPAKLRCQDVPLFWHQTNYFGTAVSMGGRNPCIEPFGRRLHRIQISKITNVPSITFPLKTQTIRPVFFGPNRHLPDGDRSLRDILPVFRRSHPDVTGTL